MNAAIMKFFGIATGCLGLTTAAALAQSPVEQQAARTAEHRPVDSRVAVSFVRTRRGSLQG